MCHIFLLLGKKLLCIGSRTYSFINYFKSYHLEGSIDDSFQLCVQIWFEFVITLILFEKYRLNAFICGAPPSYYGIVQKFYAGLERPSLTSGTKNYDLFLSMNSLPSSSIASPFGTRRNSSPHIFLKDKDSSKLKKSRKSDAQSRRQTKVEAYEAFASGGTSRGWQN